MSDIALLRVAAIPIDSDRRHHARELIDYAAARLDKVFNEEGTIDPTWVAYSSEFKFILDPQNDDKDKITDALRHFFESMEVYCYAFVSEGWILNSRVLTEEQIQTLFREGIEHNPDAREVIIIFAEDHVEGLITAERPIIRTEGQQASLGPLLVRNRSSYSEGRLASMLPPQAGQRRDN